MCVSCDSSWGPAPTFLTCKNRAAAHLFTFQISCKMSPWPRLIRNHSGRELVGRGLQSSNSAKSTQFKRSPIFPKESDLFQSGLVTLCFTLGSPSSSRESSHLFSFDLDLLFSRHRDFPLIGLYSCFC